MNIHAAVVHAKGAPFTIETVELAEPKAGEMLVKIVACGVCHTDESGQNCQVPTPLPAVLGHEGAGVVIEARHLCMQMRGVEKQHSIMTTSSMVGSFRRELATRNEFTRPIR